MPDHEQDSIDGKKLQQMMERVLEAEQDKLYMRSPIGINNDIKQIIEEEVE